MCLVFSADDEKILLLFFLSFGMNVERERER